MPELPEVELLRQYFQSTSLHQKIDDTETQSEIILKNISPQWLGRKLSGNSFESTRRHGKFFFASLETGPDWLVLHFGMTGGLKYYKNPGHKPDYEQISFHFNNGYTLGYISPRKLGEVSIISDVNAFLSDRNIGPDVCSDSFDFDNFCSLLKGRHGMIKPALMNQSIMAGIGNIYSDEILYQAKVHPETKVNNLTKEDLKEIFDQIEIVMRTIIEKKANPDEYPDSFITPLRGKDSPKCPSCNGDFVNKKISGRSAYFCPHCQKINNRED